MVTDCSKRNSFQWQLELAFGVITNTIIINPLWRFDYNIYCILLCCVIMLRLYQKTMSDLFVIFRSK